MAAPHARADGKLVALAQTDHDNNAPAGVHQLLRGGSGEVDDPAIEPRRQAVQRGAVQGDVVGADHPADRRPAKDAPAAFAAVQPNFSAYGLGWVLRDYRGRKMVNHTGRLAGYVSRTTLIPD